MIPNYQMLFGSREFIEHAIYKASILGSGSECEVAKYPKLVLGADNLPHVFKKFVAHLRH